MHALEWIRTRGSRMRTISAARLRRALGRSKGTCTWCGGTCKYPRRTWCSAACFGEFERRCTRRGARYARQRDGYACVLCGLRQAAVNRLSAWLQRYEPEAWGHYRAYLQAAGFQRRNSRWLLLEVDHIRPVSAGGGLCGLENYRTLCAVCHRGVTQRVLRERKRRRR
ncbi:MAG: hypothetical protein E6Q97_20080 [Desulfurellales bacterium]|nr:MAG: hypothetical protein E6Q97_20080 [Desulfurellales bacterium]